MTALPYPLLSCRDVVGCWDQGPVLAELAPPAPPAPLAALELAEEAPPPLDELLAEELLAEELEVVPTGAASPRGYLLSRQIGPYFVSVQMSGVLQSPWPFGQGVAPPKQ